MESNFSTTTGHNILPQSWKRRGLEEGTVNAIYGPSMSGKTTKGLEMVAMLTARGAQVLFVDLDKAYDEGYAACLGCPVHDKLLLDVWTPQGERTYSTAAGYLSGKADEYDFIIIDSIVMDGAHDRYWQACFDLCLANLPTYGCTIFGLFNGNEVLPSWEANSNVILEVSDGNLKFVKNRNGDEGTPFYLEGLKEI